ncbi:hypothetical protein LHFGNBLO_001344 [Mesorhizobium sp. AR10]|uniref:hypothetical protein n=1 Tax=Mesorhizobium sp. AR10 TaxID=2865839 RepID=UPI002160E68C|nr:hypothetical protein [Mesorhizobium sp. AR10]UVK39929.1 hypothetical protein LHFGNBLO_001344 [Mesorhizobium sp. AR10]
MANAKTIWRPLLLPFTLPSKGWMHPLNCWPARSSACRGSVAAMTYTVVPMSFAIANALALLLVVRTVWLLEHAHDSGTAPAACRAAEISADIACRLAMASQVNRP